MKALRDDREEIIRNLGKRDYEQQVQAIEAALEAIRRARGQETKETPPHD
jgi:hypothetical protein